MQIKNNKTLVQMSCTSYIMYTFHLTLHHANFGQCMAKLVLSNAKRRFLVILKDPGEIPQIKMLTRTYKKTSHTM